MNWTRLLARSAAGRRAIYDERFPARWDKVVGSVGGLGLWDFTEDEAMAVLVAFATHWDELPNWNDDPHFRFHVLSLDVTGTTERVAVLFTGRALRNDQVVISHPIVVRRYNNEDEDPPTDP